MVIDTSALVALLAEEPDATRIATAIERSDVRRIPSVVRLEATVVLTSILDRDPAVVAASVDNALSRAGFTSIAIDDDVTRLAISAFVRYGKGRGHPARLNIADCFVYGAARSVDLPLLFIGDDFTHTDLVSVLPDPRPS